MSFDRLELARALVAIPSTPEMGTIRIARFVAERMEKLGLDVELRESEFRGLPQANVIGVVGPESDDDLLVNVHLDTVPTGDERLWTKCGGDPFRLTADGDAIHGLGVADVKVALVPIFEALAALGPARLDPARMRARLILVGTYAEETGLVGAKHLAANDPPRARYAIATEPTELEIVTAHKGLMAWEMDVVAVGEAGGRYGRPRARARVEGRSAHSSTPAHGENALAKALEVLASRDPGAAVYRVAGGTALNVVPAEAEILGDAAAPDEEPYEGSERECMPPVLVDALVAIAAGLRAIPHRWPPAARFDPPGMTHNLAVMEAEGCRARLQFEFRPIPGVDREGVEAAVRDVVGDARARFSTVSVDARCTRWSDPMVTAEDAALVRHLGAALEGAGLPARLATKAGCTEAGVWRGLGMEAVVFGPSRAVGNTHKPNERASLDELGRAAGVYRNLFERLLL
ncbi:MAG: M20/M25/M40 family metallo-hydrolase [Myxococcales bacterium]|nr:M20/M25/M40 family metallo-hydrolase [Myxococcales bacterium]